jgi:hypothetical protein
LYKKHFNFNIKKFELFSFSMYIFPSQDIIYMKASFQGFWLSSTDTERETDPLFDNSLFDKETGLQAAYEWSYIRSTPTIWLWTADKASQFCRQRNYLSCLCKKLNFGSRAGFWVYVIVSGTPK